MHEPFTGVLTLTDWSKNVTEITEKIRKLAAKLAKPNIYWKSGHAKLKRHLAKSQSAYRDNSLFVAGTSNVLAVITPKILDAKDVSEKLANSASSLALAEYDGGYLYEAACILEPDKLVAAMRTVHCFRVYPEKMWDEMLAAATSRNESSKGVESRKV